jgi:hypothetical protein
MRIVSLKPAIGLAGTRSCSRQVYSRQGSESLEKSAVGREPSRQSRPLRDRAGAHRAAGMSAA